MKKFTPYKILCLTLGLGIAFSSSTVVNAASVTKTLKALYSNIGISYNGQIKPLSIEPFMINGTTYVPLRAVSEIMGAGVTWSNNTVYITNQTSTAASDQEVAAKNFQIASLTQQLDAAKKELETLKGTNASTGTTGSNLNTVAINKTLNKIIDDYSDEYKVDWGFDLALTSGRLELTVSYDGRTDKSDFEDTTESKRKQFIKNICYDIASAHSDVEIRGKIQDSRSDVEKATFKYSRTAVYDYSEINTYSLKDFGKKLEKDYSYIEGLAFKLPINYIDLSERKDTLTFTITTTLRPSSSDYRVQWNQLTPTDIRQLERFLEEIVDDLKDEYSQYDEFECVIKDPTYGIMGSYEDDDFTLKVVVTN